MNGANHLHRRFPWIYILILFCFTVGCQQTETTPEPVDVPAIEEAVTSLLQVYNDAVKAKDLDVLTAMMSDDIFVCGTDPDELWDKDVAIASMTEMMDNPSAEYNYNIDRRELRVAPDGKTVIGVEQISDIWFSPNLPGRTVYHVRKAGESWVIDLMCWSFIAENEDIETLNQALESE